MLGMRIMELQVYKAPGKLNQSLVKKMIGRGSPVPEPKMLKHIMGFIITLGIKTLEITEIAGIKSYLIKAVPGSEFLHKYFHALGFIHRLVLTQREAHSKRTKGLTCE